MNEDVSTGMLPHFTRPIVQFAETQTQVCIIMNMLDPEGIYSATLGVADISKSSTDILNVHDGNGTLIMPE